MSGPRAAAASVEQETPSAPAGRESGTGDSTAAMLPFLGRRIAPRYVFEVPVKIIAASEEGEAVLRDISVSGARLECTAVRPELGERLRIEFALFEDSLPIELTGEMARATETGGFCIRFLSLSQRHCQILQRLPPRVASARVESGPGPACSGRVVLDLGSTLHQVCVDAGRSAGLGLEDWIKKQLHAAAAAQLESLREGGPGSSG